MRATVRYDSDGRAYRDRIGKSAACNKQTYATKKLAKERAGYQSRSSGEHIEAYHCFRCHCFHLGHPPAPYDPQVHRVRLDEQGR